MLCSQRVSRKVGGGGGDIALRLVLAPALPSPPLPYEMVSQLCDEGLSLFSSDCAGYLTTRRAEYYAKVKQNTRKSRTRRENIKPPVGSSRTKPKKCFVRRRTSIQSSRSLGGWNGTKATHIHPPLPDLNLISLLPPLVHARAGHVSSTTQPKNAAVAEAPPFLFFLSLSCSCYPR